VLDYARIASIGRNTRKEEETAPLRGERNCKELKNDGLMELANWEPKDTLSQHLGRRGSWENLTGGIGGKALGEKTLFSWPKKKDEGMTQIGGAACWEKTKEGESKSSRTRGGTEIVEREH